MIFWLIMQAAAVFNSLEQLTFERMAQYYGAKYGFRISRLASGRTTAESRWRWFNCQYFVNQRQSCVGDVLWLLLRQSRYDDVQQVCSPTFLGDECGRQMQHCSPGPIETPNFKRLTAAEGAEQLLADWQGTILSLKLARLRILVKWWLFLQVTQPVT